MPIPSSQPTGSGSMRFPTSSWRSAATPRRNLAIAERPSTFDHYNIVSEDDLRPGGAEDHDVRGHVADEASIANQHAYHLRNEATRSWIS